MRGCVQFSLLAVLGGVCCQPALAQASGAAPPNRAAAEALVVAKAQQAKNASDTSAAPLRSGAASAPKTVAERKSETLEAMRKGQLVPAGHGSPGQPR